MESEVYIQIDGRIVKIDLESECGYSEVEWADENDEEEEWDEELEKARINRIINDCLGE